MSAAFTSLRIGLMVGIGGGVPSEEADIRLGDVVVSNPHKVHGGVVQYDFGKTTPSGFVRTGSLNTPPTILLNAITNLRAKHIRGICKFPDYISNLHRLPDFTRESAGPDILFEAEYNHEGGAMRIPDAVYRDESGVFSGTPTLRVFPQPPGGETSRSK